MCPDAERFGAGLSSICSVMPSFISPQAYTETTRMELPSTWARERRASADRPPARQITSFSRRSPPTLQVSTFRGSTSTHHALGKGQSVRPSGVHAPSAYKRAGMPAEATTAPLHPPLLEPFRIAMRKQLRGLVLCVGLISLPAASGCPGTSRGFIASGTTPQPSKRPAACIRKQRLACIEGRSPPPRA